MKRIICWLVGHDFIDPTNTNYVVNCWRCGVVER